MVDRRTVLGAAAGTVASLLAGCGGSSDGTPETTGEARTTTGDTVVGPTSTASATAGAGTPDGTTEAETAAPTTDAELSALERRVVAATADLRESMVAVDRGVQRPVAAGWFVRPDVFVTEPSVTEGEPTFERLDGAAVSATLLGATDPAATGARVAAYRTEGEYPAVTTAPGVSLDEEQVVATVAFQFAVREWRPAYGRVLDWTDGGRFLTSVPLTTIGTLVTTLEGAVVGLTDEFAPPDGARTEIPPTPAPTEVHTSRASWRRLHHTPVDAVLDAVDRWTE